jgi:hypothetical protein
MLDLRGYAAILTIARASGSEEPTARRGAVDPTNYAFALPASSVPN